MKFISKTVSEQRNYGVPGDPKPYNVEVSDLLYEVTETIPFTSLIPKLMADAEKRTEGEYIGSAWMNDEHSLILLSYRGDKYA